MDGHGDYSSLERSRLLESSLEGGSGSSGGRAGGGGGGRPASVSEFTARVATPTTLPTLTPYHNRYGLLSPLPGFPRYLMTGGLYPPYPSLLPGSAESLSLLGTGVACVAGAVTTGAGSSQPHQVAHYQRFLEIQKEAYLASMSAAASHHTALYGISPTTLPTFLDQTVVSSHSAAPLSLVKQEPKELAGSEKAAKQNDRRATGFKVDLDYNRSSTTLANSASGQLKEPKLSPLSSSPVSGKSKKTDTNLTPSVGCSTDHHNGKRSSLPASGISNTVRKNHSSSKPSRSTPSTPALSQNPANSNSNSSSVPKKNGRRTSFSVSKHTKTSTLGQATSSSNTPTPLPSPIPSFSGPPLVNVQTQVSATSIPVALVQHDSVILSALACPSSAATSFTTKLVTLKQAGMVSHGSVGDKETTHAGTAVSYGLADKQISIASSCDQNVAGGPHPRNNTSNNVTVTSSSVNGLDTSTKRGNSRQHSDDSSDININSTESDDRKYAESTALHKTEHKCAVEETIERVASGISSDVESDMDDVICDQGSKPSNDSTHVFSLLTSSRMESSSTAASPMALSTTRTVYSKAQPVPSAVISGNIPVGIAVAQIRPHQIQQSKESSTSETLARDSRPTHSSVSAKVITQTSASLAVPATALAPSLVVTGTGVSQSSWLQQMPFPLHQAVNSPGTPFDSSFPITAPNGFKFAQDSLTGRIFLVPGGDMNFVEQGAVWTSSSFAAPTEAGKSYQTNVTLPTITVNGSEKRDVKSTENNPEKITLPANTLDKIIPAPEVVSKDRPGLAIDVGKHHVIAQPILGGNSSSSSSNNNNNNSPSQGLIAATTAATVLVNPVTNISTISSGMLVKMERPTVESRGCSPIMFEDVSSSLSLLSTLSSMTSKKPDTCTVGVQTCSILMKGSRKKKSSPQKLTFRDQAIQTSTSDLTTLNPLSVQCPDLYTVDPLAHNSLEVKDGSEHATYNPFTDPQILQAADGLELLSTLAEKRPKCSSVDDPKRIFPSPSDSFKSDSTSVVAFEDTLSPGDSELKSGQCTPRRDIRRELSPKWTLPKKEPQALSVFGDFKTPSEIEISEDSEVRVKLAEVQRQYKEKQKELAKIQNKKTEEGKALKRGPGRPPKKKTPTKKSDDDSSSSSSRPKDHHQPHKKKRPAEELVDRVFRKLPPVIKPGKVSRSIHYVKSKTGPFFRRKSASSLVKRNKDLFGYDESNWPSFSERKHQEKVKESGSISVKSKNRHRSGSSLSEDSKHGQDLGNIFSNLDSFRGDSCEKKVKQPKSDSHKLKKSSSSSLSTSTVTAVIKTEPCPTSTQQESGLGLLAKFALHASTAPLSSLVTSTLPTIPVSDSYVTVSSVSSFNSSISSSGMYNTSSTVYNISSASVEGHASYITFSPMRSLMSLTSPGSVDSNSKTVAPAAVSVSTSVAPAAVSVSTSVAPAAVSVSTSVAPAAVSVSTSAAPAAVSGSTAVAIAAVSGSTSAAPVAVSESTAVAPVAVSESTAVALASVSGSIAVAPAVVSVSTYIPPAVPTTAESSVVPPANCTLSASVSTPASPQNVIDNDQAMVEISSTEVRSYMPDCCTTSGSSIINCTTDISTDSSTTNNKTVNSSSANCGVVISGEMANSRDVSPAKRKLEEDSDTDNSDTSPNKKRKPGRPRKINPDKSSSGTETIWAKKSSTVSLLQVPETNNSQSKDDEIKLDPNVMKPLFLDEEWTRRRSERIFLSEPSPQPSPAIPPSPRGEPVWKLSNFMPKSKKSVDENKTTKENNQQDSAGSTKAQSSDSSVGAANSSSPSLSDSSHSVPVKAEEREQIQTSSTAKAVEISTLNAEDAKKIVKLEDTTSAATLPTPSEKSKNSKQDGAKKKKKICTKMKKIEDQPVAQPSSTDVAKKEKRAEEHSKIKLQKAKSLYDLTQRVKNKFSKTNIRKQEDHQKSSKSVKKKRKISTDSSDSDNIPLAAYRDDPPTPEPRSCKLQLSDLKEGLKVLYLIDGLFHEGTVKALQPPDVYGVLTAGQRGTRPHILCLEEILKWAVLDVKPGSMRYLPEGTRVCAFWSQQFSCLYPGTVAKSSPTSSGKKVVVPVEFDDGDNGRIELDHIRLLPSDFPIVEYEPDPLEALPKRKQRSTSDASDRRKSVDTEPKSRKACKEDDDDDDNDDDDDRDNDSSESDNDEPEKSGAVTKRELWKWKGSCTKRPGLKGKAKKVFYKAVARRKEIIKIGDSAVFVSKDRVDCPYIGRIESLWEGWNGQMMVRVQWYYHPEETECDKKLSDPRNALFESQHEDENDVQTIAHKCEVLSYAQYKKQMSNATKKGKSFKPKVFFVAGFYDPAAKNVSFHPGVS